MSVVQHCDDYCVRRLAFFSRHRVGKSEERTILPVTYVGKNEDHSTTEKDKISAREVSHKARVEPGAHVGGGCWRGGRCIHMCLAKLQ